MKKFLYCISAVILVCALCFALGACNKTKEDEPPEDVIDQPVRAEGIALNWQEALMAKGASLNLTHTLSPDGATGTATYTSDNTAVAQVNDQGLVSAVAAGVATVTVRVDDTHYAECRVVVGDIVVEAPAAAPQTTPQGEEQGNNTGDTTGDTAGGETQDTGDAQGSGNAAGNENQGTGDATGGESQSAGGNQNETDSGTNNTTGGNGATIDTPADGNTDAETSALRRIVVGTSGTTLFNSVSSAIAAAEASDTIVIAEGTYAEDVRIDKTLSLMGVNNPQLQAVTVAAERVKLHNLNVMLADYPEAGQAAVHVLSGAGLEMDNCAVGTNAQGELTGGYGLLVEKQSKGIKVTGNSIGNFRYGIYVCPTDQAVTITSNKFSNMAVGVGLDLRQENADTNYPTQGRIAANEYNEVTKHTQFLHYGENYEGDFDFADNEQENASQGNSNTGGSGLLE